jgi:hypothetical protein
MDLQTLREWEPPPERFTPEWGGNRESDEPFVVLHRPFLREYQLRWLELQARLEERGIDGGDTYEGSAAVLRAATAEGDTYRRDFLSAHVAGCEGLTDGGEPVSLDGLLALMEEVPDLGREVLTHVVIGGTLTEADEGN